jgi:site-specific DNA-methyltransferase (cytosine-N4-specific)
MWAVRCVDVRAGLRAMPPESVQCCVTSPPYWGLRDYGIAPSVWGGLDGHPHVWGGLERGKRADMLPADQTTSTARIGTTEEGNAGALNGGRFCECGAWLGCLGLEPTQDLYVEHVVEVFAEVWRVLRKDGTLWINLGDSYAGSRRGGYVGDATTLQGSTEGQDQSRIAAMTQSRRRDDEMIPRSDVLVDGCKPKDLVGIPWLVAFALRGAGWYLRSEVIWSKPNAMPESIRDRPAKAHETVFLLAKSRHYYYDADAIKEPIAADTEARMRRAYAGYAPPGQGEHHGVGAPRPNSNKFPSGWDKENHGRGPDGLVGRYKTPATPATGQRPDWTGKQEAQAVAGVAKRPKGNAKTFRGGGAYTGNRSFDNSVDVERESTGNVPNETGMRNKRTVWTIATSPFRDAHFATFPPELPRICVLAGSRPLDLVLDPFNGSGTTGEVSIDLGRNYVGLDVSPAYCEMARTRLRGCRPLLSVEGE